MERQGRGTPHAIFQKDKCSREMSPLAVISSSSSRNCATDISPLKIRITSCRSRAKDEKLRGAAHFIPSSIVTCPHMLHIRDAAPTRQSVPSPLPQPYPRVRCGTVRFSIFGSILRAFERLQLRARLGPEDSPACDASINPLTPTISSELFRFNPLHPLIMLGIIIQTFYSIL